MVCSSLGRGFHSALKRSKNKPVISYHPALDAILPYVGKIGGHGSLIHVLVLTPYEFTLFFSFGSGLETIRLV